MKKQLAVLEISCWSFSINGEHYYGKIFYYDEFKKLQKIKITHPLSEKESIYLNKKNQTSGFSLYKKGELSEKFESEQELIRYAIKTYEKINPKPFALAKGMFSVCDPQEILEGPTFFKHEVNKLFREFERIGGYEGDEKRCEKLFHEYQKILKKYEL